VTSLCLPVLDQGSTEEFVRVRLLLDATLPAPQPGGWIVGAPYSVAAFTVVDDRIVAIDIVTDPVRLHGLPA